MFALQKAAIIKKKQKKPLRQFAKKSKDVNGIAITTTKTMRIFYYYIFFSYICVFLSFSLSLYVSFDRIHRLVFQQKKN
jgi:hypothetical protein